MLEQHRGLAIRDAPDDAGIVRHVRHPGGDLRPAGEDPQGSVRVARPAQIHGLQGVAEGDAPDHHALVGAERGQPVAVGEDLHLEEARLVPQHLQALAQSGFPHDALAVVAGRDEPLPVGEELDVGDGPVVRREPALIHLGIYQPEGRRKPRRGRQRYQARPRHVAEDVANDICGELPCRCSSRRLLGRRRLGRRRRHALG
mmetsp:Transcript_95113/g.266324  ORF Transcript_95113/g.266324 Transcript_95113/m.266324 type:complete len:201 (-) Transcript_95113:178-780(-)